MTHDKSLQAAARDLTERIWEVLEGGQYSPRFSDFDEVLEQIVLVVGPLLAAAEARAEKAEREMAREVGNWKAYAGSLKSGLETSLAAAERECDAAQQRAEVLAEAARPYLAAQPGWLPEAGAVRSVGVTERQHRALWDAVAAYGPPPPAPPESGKEPPGSEEKPPSAAWLVTCLGTHRGRTAPHVQRQTCVRPERYPFPAEERAK